MLLTPLWILYNEQALTKISRPYGIINLTITPRARMSSESIAHEAEFSKIQLPYLFDYKPRPQTLNA